MMPMTFCSIQLDINSAGAQLVVEWGVILYVKRGLCIFCLNVSFSFLFLFTEFQKIWTVLAACPFTVGWYSTVRIWCIPFCWRNFSNSKLANKLPLSITIYSGSPKFAKIMGNFSIVFVEVALAVGIMLIHFEKESTTIKNILLQYGPA